nr:iron ABC transporter permease [Pseudenhygromyxa sp. WMMC2535]
MLVLTFLLEVGVGSMAISPRQLAAIVLDSLGFEGAGLASYGAAERTVLLALRLPRALGAGLVGAGLAVAGAALQGLFRNPLASPQLIGVSSGAAAGAALTLVLGAPLLSLGLGAGGLLSAAAFLGALVTSVTVYKLASVDGRPSVTHMLLAGIAMSALCAALVGAMQYLADDVELRDLSLWMLGDVGRNGWDELPWLALGVLPGIVLLQRLGRALDVSVLGDAAAHDLGVDLVRLRRRVVLLSALVVGSAVACSGPIAFVGLAVPHLVRLLRGPRHSALIIDSAVLGAALLLGADALARTMAAPAELPVGVLTAFIGAPLFISLLIRDLRGRR